MGDKGAPPGESSRAFVERTYLTHERLMYAIALRVLNNLPDAQDAVNTACLALVKRAEELSGFDEVSLRCYVASCVKNAALNLAARQSREGRLGFSDGGEMVNQVADKQSTEDAMLYNARREQLKNALRALPENERNLLQMKVFDGMEDKEIAKRMGIPQAHVRVYISRARKHLSELLRREEQE